MTSLRRKDSADIMKNVCIVGYGAIGPIHAAAIEKVQSAKLYAICDIVPERCARCSEQYPGIKEYYDFDKMLEDDAIDSVHICTPHYLHYEMIVKALDKGKTVRINGKRDTKTGFTSITFNDEYGNEFSGYI